MEPEVSLLHPQVPVTCPYPEPSRSSPCLTSHFLQIHLNIIPPIYDWVLQVISFLQVSPPKPCIRLSSPPYALHAPPISLFSILSPAQYFITRTILAEEYRSLRYSLCGFFHSIVYCKNLRVYYNLYSD